MAFPTLLGLAMFASLLVTAARVDAATRTWDGGGADTNWSTPANWSSDTLPVAGDTVTFNATSTKNVTINVPVTVAIFQMNAGVNGGDRYALAAGCRTRCMTCLRRLAVFGLASLIVAGCSSPTPSAGRNPAALVEGEPYSVMIATEQFSHPLANDYYPLESGVMTVFEGGDERVEVKVTSDTKVIMGVTTHVITDQVFVDAELTEDTVDWYAADNLGNVWYFGEETAEYENGEITSTEGSWEAGVDGALPGIIMLADPRVGDAYRQEFYEGQAEDVAKIYAVDQSITVPKDTYDLVLVTEDWSLLDPDVHERKSYAPRIGVVFEETVQGGSGTLSLIDVIRD